MTVVSSAMLAQDAFKPKPLRELELDTTVTSNFLGQSQPSSAPA
jgi:hypothetical protein